MNAVVEQAGQLVPMEPATLIEVISRAAQDPNTDVDKLERLLGMYERITAKRSEQLYHAAMTAAQTEIRPIAADASNPQTKSKYASYPALDRALRPIYTKHGFALSFDTGDGAPENCVKVLCVVSHAEGHSRTFHVDMPADGKGAKGGDVMTRTHATGAGLTYGQRYLLKLIFNIAVALDDDGNGASSVDDGSYVNMDQVQKIKDLLDRTKADTALFCKYMGVEAMRDIMARDFGKAMTALNLKEKKIQK